MAVIGFCSLDLPLSRSDWRLRRTSWLLTKYAFDSSSNSVAERWLHGSREIERKQVDPRLTDETSAVSLSQSIKVSFITVRSRKWLDLDPLRRWFMSWTQLFDIKQRCSWWWWHADFVWQKWNDIVLHHWCLRERVEEVSKWLFDSSANQSHRFPSLSICLSSQLHEQSRQRIIGRTLITSSRSTCLLH